MRRRSLLIASIVMPFVGAPVVEPAVLRVPEPILELIGDSILERVFHDALFPKMLYRTGGSSAHIIIDDPVKRAHSDALAEKRPAAANTLGVWKTKWLGRRHEG